MAVNEPIKYKLLLTFTIGVGICSVDVLYPHIHSSAEQTSHGMTDHRVGATCSHSCYLK